MYQKSWYVYCSWDMMHYRCNRYFSFWAMFCPFTTLTAWKIEIKKKTKKHLEISFYTSVPKIMIICYTVPEILHVMNAIVIFHFGLFFALLPPTQPKKQKLFKKWKKTPGDIITDQIMYSSWDMVHSRWTDGWTERWKKWHIEVGAPPNNYHRCYENTFIFHVKANQKKLISCKIKLLKWSL